MSARPRVRALVLAAGYGSRLRPLTLTTPKPLMPVLGAPVVDHTVARLARVGCEVAVLNLHHLADEIPAALGLSCHGVPLRYHHEQEILGTLGPLVAARTVLDDADVVLMINGDALCTWPFERLIRRHLSSGAEATLLVHDRLDPRAYGGGIGLDRDGRVVAMRDAPAVGDVVRRKIFTGAHALSPRLLDDLIAGPGDIVADLYLPMLARRATIGTVGTRRSWHDLGTPQRYWRGVLDRARGHWPGWLWRGNRIASDARVAGGARVRRSVVEAGAEIEAGTTVDRCVVLGGRIGAGSVVRRCVIGPGVDLETATITGCLVSTLPPHYNKAANESVLGSLVYTPLEG